MLSQDEIERRRQFVTASEMAAVLGCSPYANAADVYYSKLHGVAFKGNDATEAGNLLEPSCINWAKSVIGPIDPGDWRVHEDGIIACSLDGITPAGEPVEAKTSGIVGPGFPQLWGDEKTDEIPDYYLVQVQTQLLCTGAARGFVPALIGNRGFVMYIVGQNKEFQGYIKATAEAFWNNNILARVPPEDVTPNLETLRRMFRTPGKSVEIPDQLAADFIEAQAAAKIANEREEKAKAALIAAIGDGEVAKWSGGEFTFREQTRKGHVVNDSTFRVLRAKPVKGDSKCLAK